jgi:nucleotidyltransferase/DNA polymerase involved in DNA repair
VLARARNWAIFNCCRPLVPLPDSIAGIAHSKLLAKLCSGLNKPNKQTVVPLSSVSALLNDLPIEKLRGLGGILGQRVQRLLGVNTVGVRSVAFKLH